MSRSISHAAPGELRIEQRIRIDGDAVGTDVSGPACILADVRLRRGNIAYRCGQRIAKAPAAFRILIPPFTMVEALLDRADATSIAFAFRPTPDLDLPAQPILVPTGGHRPIHEAGDVGEWLRDRHPAIEIGRTAAAPSRAGRAKRVIDREYARRLRIGDLAARLDVTPAVLSRTFRAAYGLPPVRYRHQVRVVDALMRFAAGAAPVEVFQDVGFDDLSRFYKIFRRVACAPPGRYRRGDATSSK